MDRIELVTSIINYIESNLDEKLDLDKISQAMHYSKYHMHRQFALTVGMTIRDYVHRRQLTEAAKLLVFSDMSIIQIALMYGYESQRAFSLAFKLMYKTSPAHFRRSRSFYPLQLRWHFCSDANCVEFTEDEIRLAVKSDLNAWLRLAEMVVDGYPHMDEIKYRDDIIKYIDANTALVLYDGRVLVGALAYSNVTGSIDFFGVHPQYRELYLHNLFLNVLTKKYLAGRVISMTTFREGDKADTGYRKLLKQLGFVERELLVEFDYPTQRFIKNMDDLRDDEL